jgi:hypothetical protein
MITIEEIDDVKPAKRGMTKQIVAAVALVGLTLVVVVGFALPGSSAPSATSTPGTSVATTPDPIVAAAESAFQQAEGFSYSLFAPPATANVHFQDSPVAPSISQGANGPAVYTPAIQKEILDQANTELPKVMTPQVADRVLQTVSGFISNDNGPNMDVIGGEGADVLSFDSPIVNGTNATVSATVRLWTKTASINPNDGQLNWNLLQGQVKVVAQMVLGADGRWRESSQTMDFLPGSHP